MAETIAYLLCVLLIFKGIEILQAGLTSSSSSYRKMGIVIGAASMIVALWLAISFGMIISEHSKAETERPKEVPKVITIPNP